LTDEEQELINEKAEAEHASWVASEERRELEKDNERLRALLAGVQWIWTGRLFNGLMVMRCHWCHHEQTPPRQLTYHADDCPAFTVNGVVK
jgi:hypothetical protein